MTVSDDDLRYETHIGFYRNHGHLSGDAEKDAYWHYQAQDQHMLCVIDGAGDIQTGIVSIGQQLPMGAAYHHLVFGAARRSRMIWGGLRHLHSLIAPDRKQPLPHDDVFEAARALNDIYIHTRGVMDNYAWSILHLFGDETLKRLHQNNVGLFIKRFCNNPSVSDFGEISAEFSDWHNEIKQRRDPVAHRIPLSVPPALLNEEDQAAYFALNEEANAAQLEFFEKIRLRAPQVEIDAASEKHEGIVVRMAKIGTFVPMIVHNPDDGGTRIYPTVPQDVGNLVLLCRQLNNRIVARLAR